MHDKTLIEVRANKNAKKYFGKYYGVDWNARILDGNKRIEDKYPTYKWWKHN